MHLRFLTEYSNLLVDADKLKKREFEFIISDGYKTGHLTLEYQELSIHIVEKTIELIPESDLVDLIFYIESLLTKEEQEAFLIFISIFPFVNYSSFLNKFEENYCGYCKFERLYEAKDCLNNYFSKYDYHELGNKVFLFNNIKHGRKVNQLFLTINGISYDFNIYNIESSNFLKVVKEGYNSRSLKLYYDEKINRTIYDGLYKLIDLEDFLEILEYLNGFENIDNRKGFFIYLCTYDYEDDPDYFIGKFEESYEGCHFNYLEYGKSIASSLELDASLDYYEVKEFFDYEGYGKKLTREGRDSYELEGKIYVFDSTEITRY